MRVGSRRGRAEGENPRLPAPLLVSAPIPTVPLRCARGVSVVESRGPGLGGLALRKGSPIDHLERGGLSRPSAFPLRLVSEGCELAFMVPAVESFGRVAHDPAIFTPPVSVCGGTVLAD